MANVKISDLPAATSLATTDIFPLVQSSLTKQATFSLLPFLQNGNGAVATNYLDRGRLVLYAEDYLAFDGTDESTQWSKLLTQADSAACGIVFPRAGLTLKVQGFSIANGGTVPAFIDFGGCTIKAATGSSGVFITVENPHTTRPQFWMANGVIDANSLCTVPLKIHGSQNCSYIRLQCKNGTSHGFQLAGESGFGIYGNLFQSILASGNAGAGFSTKSTGGLYYINANVWTMCSSLSNTSYGLDIDYAGGTYNGFWAESNSAAGVNIDHSVMAVFNGGHFESNNAPDASFAGTSNSKGVMVIGTRCLGTISGFTTAVTTGNIFLPSTVTSQVFSFDGSNLYITGGASFTTGLSLDGLSVIDNYIRFDSSASAGIGLGSTGYLQFDQARSQLRAQKSLALSAAAVSQAAGEVGLGNGTQTTVGAAGTAASLPGDPSGYLKIYIGTNQYVIPYWNQA